MSSGVNISTKFDREYVFKGGNSVRFLSVDLTGPDATMGKAEPKAPLNIALVIDASASMAGRRLDAAVESALGVVHSLSSDSCLSIVSFATSIFVHVDGQKMNGEGKKAAIAALEALVTRDSTDVCSGWMKGAECVAKVMQRQSNMHNHVIIISDGHANIGTVDAKILGNHADELRQRGVLTTCVGIGNDYSSVQLQALAEPGGGRLHDAEFPQEIIEVLLGELRELQETVVEDISVLLKFPSSARVKNISGFPTAFSNSSLVCQMGSLPPGGKRNVIFRIITDAGIEGDQLKFEATCNWMWTGKDKRDKSKPASRVLTVAPGDINSNQSRDIDLSVKVAEIWQSAIVRRAVQINRDGNLSELGKYLDYELKNFCKYCAELPGTDELIMALENMRAVADRDWDERSRKSMEYTTYLTQTSQIDHRTLERAGWWKFLEERKAKLNK
ncbi:MAG: VWA domain-containing protein [Candidatus Melainabacteria bacterium]|nr:VWA domain-containing protein [Candidatus Melainabacteria bacterium]